MKITMIHGQSHKGSTYHIGRMVTDKLGGEVTEFFLPRDFGSFCIGCANCFSKDEKFCPHYKELETMTKAIDEADVLILASPVYVFHVTGPMKTFLDHYGYRWLVHRPEEKMFSKQAVCISTAAGGGTKSTNKDMADSLFFWGIPVVHKYGVGVRAIEFEQISEKILKKIEKKTTYIARKIKAREGKVRPGIKTLGLFYIMRMVNKTGWNEVDSKYWKEKGWTKRNRPWKKLSV